MVTGSGLRPDPSGNGWADMSRAPAAALRFFFRRIRENGDPCFRIHAGTTPFCPYGRKQGGRGRGAAFGRLYRKPAAVV